MTKHPDECACCQSGMDPEDFQEKYLARMGNLVKKEGGFPLDTPIRGVVTGFPVRWRAPTPGLYQHCTFSHLFYQKTFPLVQIVWPDRHGLFPGDPGVDRAMAAVQTIQEPS